MLLINLPEDSLIQKGPLSRSLYSHKILAQLRLEIITNELSREALLSETQSAQRFGVSRGPVRDALEVLKKEGLLRSLANGRTQVVGFSVQDALDLYEVRFSLESLAIRRAADRAQSEPQELLRAAEATQIFDQSDPEVTTDHDMAFHESLIHLSGNRALEQSWQLHRPLLGALCTLTNYDAKRYERIVNEHMEMAEAISSGRIDQALPILEEHLTRGCELMRKRLERMYED